MASTRTFKFIEAPPERNMRRKSPESAPRLFDWLVENGYVESVSTRGKTSRTNYISADLNSAVTGGGRVGSGKKKRKKSPF